MSYSADQLLQKALDIVELATEKQATLRLAGGVAFKAHCSHHALLGLGLDRTIHDIDFVGYSRQKREIDKVFEDLRFAKVPTSLSAAFSGREIYIEEGTNFEVDVFLDRLQMNHTIDFLGRLELDYPTVPLADMLLQKMQIVQLTEKDVSDTILLLRTHDLGTHAKETIDIRYIEGLLSQDWGFYYTVRSNLEKVTGLIDRVPTLSQSDIIDVSDKISRLRSTMEQAPKSLRWRIRAKLGAAKKWYREVEREAQPT